MVTDIEPLSNDDIIGLWLNPTHSGYLRIKITLPVTALQIIMLYANSLYTIEVVSKVKVTITSFSRNKPDLPESNDLTYVRTYMHVIMHVIMHVDILLYN